MPVAPGIGAIRFEPNALLTFAHFNGFGFSPFGIANFVNNGVVTPAAAEFEDLYRVLRPLLPLIARYQYTGKLHPLLQGIAQGEDWAYAFASATSWQLASNSRENTILKKGGDAD